MKKTIELTVDSVWSFANQLAGLLQTGVVITEAWPVTEEELAQGGKLKIMLRVQSADRNASSDRQPG